MNPHLAMIYHNKTACILRGIFTEYIWFALSVTLATSIFNSVKFKFLRSRDHCFIHWEKELLVCTCVTSTLFGWKNTHQLLNKRSLNTLRPRRNERHLADDIFKCIFLNENVWIAIEISLKFVPKGPINYIPVSELMMVRLPTHICVTRPKKG